MSEDAELEDNFVPRKCRIAYAGNTGKYALAAIYAKGYKVFIYPDSNSDATYDFWAIKDERDFIAHDPETLLGLIAIWEQFGDDWLNHTVPNYHDRLLDRTFPENEYQSFDDKTFARFVAELRIFFEAIDEPMPETITRKSLADFILNFSREAEERANRA